VGKERRAEGGGEGDGQGEGRGGGREATGRWMGRSRRVEGEGRVRHVWGRPALQEGLQEAVTKEQ
jgi:hypothetical protein